MPCVVAETPGQLGGGVSVLITYPDGSTQRIRVRRVEHITALRRACERIGYGVLVCLDCGP